MAREISGKNDLDTLLDTSASLIRERFGFYHVGIFLTDEKKEYAVLRSATGEAGQVMLERGHRLKIGEIGMVGYVVSQGEARISMDVDSDAVHYKNPLLPETRSELALPLRLGEITIGAMDVQSVVPNAFSHEDVRILQTIADQLAIAFEKTRLVVELQRSLEELELHRPGSHAKSMAQSSAQYAPKIDLPLSQRSPGKPGSRDRTCPGSNG